ncbi:heterokaryon incompatibility protein-domain-containing protein [Poronia punctata]|nr:heterokaryon incompatibility protein-domain-containing protein [Poronia punctata]
MQDDNKVGANGFKRFEYDPTDGRRIRLFKLDLNGEDEPLSGKIISVIDIGVALGNRDFRAYVKSLPEGSWLVIEKLSGSEGYDCLSWVWGPAGDEQALHLTAIGPSLRGGEVDYVQGRHRNGHVFIRPGLCEFLKECRRRKCTRFMWIDAICLDQQSDGDKSTHIPNLRAIYENAESVLYWLGTGNPVITKALKKLEDVTQALERCANDAVELWRYKSWDQFNIPPHDDEFWDGMRALITNDWWSRLWTLQEAVATKEESKRPDAKHVRVFYIGENTLPWSDIESFAKAGARCRIENWLLTGRWFIDVDNRHAFDALDEIRGCLRNYTFGTRLNAAMLATLRRKAASPVEMVLGQVALIDLKEAKKLGLSFNQQPEVAFVRFAKYYIAQEPFECLLNHTLTKERNARLPSWCPNFASSRETLSIGSLWFGDYTPDDATLQEQFYHAGYINDLFSRYTVPQSQTFGYIFKTAANLARGKSVYTDLYKTSNKRQMRALTGTDFLQLTGIDVDVVSQAIDCNLGADHEDFLSYKSLCETFRWLKECLELATSAKSYRDKSLQGATGVDLFLRTITANRCLVRAPPRDQSKYKRFLDHEGTTDFVGRYTRFMGLLEAAIGAERGIEGSGLDKDTADFADVLHSVTRQRRFFVTGHGRIGFGPSTTEPGDSVRVVWFLPTPYLFRNGKDVRFRLVGETYVHGLMYGEAIKMFKDKHLKEIRWIVE